MPGRVTTENLDAVFRYHGPDDAETMGQEGETIAAEDETTQPDAEAPRRNPIEDPSVQPTISPRFPRRRR